MIYSIAYSIAVIFYYTLFYLFLAGAIIELLSINNPKDTSALLKKVLISVFLIQFLAYMLAGIINIKFGWQRNFFYLLPIYFLVLFYFLKRIIRYRIYYYTISVIILIFFLCLNIQKVFSWEKNNLWREMVRLASKAECDSLIVSPRPINIWPFEYYTKKYSIQNRTLFLYKGAKEAEVSQVTKKLRNTSKFIVIQPFRYNFLSNKNFLDADSFEISDKKEYMVEVGPYILLREIIGYPRQYITVYSYKKKQK